MYEGRVRRAPEAARVTTSNTMLWYWCGAVQRGLHPLRPQSTTGRGPVSRSYVALFTLVDFPFGEGGWGPASIGATLVRGPQAAAHSRVGHSASQNRGRRPVVAVPWGESGRSISEFSPRLWA
ncbi:hypothetical protein NDU88_003050 [Pleurodeles waltl]|uniref:Uncharacterized protein n=1 Tax=Pleurodeles waltl TaxID=8319 RepID=A0AAV7SDF1_PLEWA|nr:hypothetical protein NDU88_003050 [Pleurodeles waltl]